MSAFPYPTPPLGPFSDDRQATTGPQPIEDSTTAKLVTLTTRDGRRVNAQVPKCCLFEDMLVREVLGHAAGFDGCRWEEFDYYRYTHGK